MFSSRNPDWTRGSQHQLEQVRLADWFGAISDLINIFEGKEPDLDNAFDKLLATFESNYQVSLHFGDQRRMLVTVREGSLEQVSEAVHPAARSHSYLSLRATYTVGKWRRGLLLNNLTVDCREHGWAGVQHGGGGAQYRDICGIYPLERQAGSTLLLLQHQARILLKTVHINLF